MTLRAVRDESPAMSRDELREYGNQVLTTAKQHAVEAMAASMIPDLITRGGLTDVYRIRVWRTQIRDLLKKWELADQELAELLRAVEKTAAQGKGMG